jgi:hypothetical protein
MRNPGPADLDPDPYPILFDKKRQKNIFARKFHLTLRNIENHDTYDAGWKEKTGFSNIFKLGGRIKIWIGIKMKKHIRIIIKSQNDALPPVISVRSRKYFFRLLLH